MLKKEDRLTFNPRGLGFEIAKLGDAGNTLAGNSLRCGE